MTLQLSLDVPTPPHSRIAGALPLREALEQLAHTWSQRLDTNIVVTGNPWAGWVIGPAS